jgi:hypothetical protein
MVSALRHAVDTLETLLAYPSCFDATRLCFFNIQNVLLISRLMNEVVKGYLEYSEWLKRYSRVLDTANENESFTFVYDKETSSSFDLLLTGGTYRTFILLGLRPELERLAKICKAFSMR